MQTSVEPPKFENREWVSQFRPKLLKKKKKKKNDDEE